MLGLRIDPPGPYWFEDLTYLVADEIRRLPRRAKRALTRTRRLARRTIEAYDAIRRFDPFEALSARLAARREPEPEPKIRPMAVEPLEEPEAWTLATGPLTDLERGTHVAVDLHEAAAEQLDALTYVLERMRDELRPVMVYAPLERATVHELPTAADLERSIQDLLELSRQNAATRPKRVRDAA